MAEAEGTASHRERSRGRSPQRPDRGRSASGMQGAESERLSRLENQATQLSDALLTLGPAISQLVQLQQAQMPPPGMPPVVRAPQTGTPVGFPNTQMPFAPNNPTELAPAATQNAPQPIPTTSQGVSPNIASPVDPLQSNDPWRNFQSPSQEAGIPDQPFPASMPASPERPRPFGGVGAAAGQIPPPPPGFPSSMVGGTSYVPIHTPGGSQQGQGNHHEDNPFKRSEKWMPDIPTPNFSDWKGRPAEITGFIDWVSALASWTGLGSNAYPGEILSCIKEPEPLGWHRLNSSQITRSVRLLSILKMCFDSHPRANLVIKNYEESRGYHRCCGFECLRLISKEFAIKTRTELLFFRNQLVQASRHRQSQKSSERFSPNCFSMNVLPSLLIRE